MARKSRKQSKYRISNTIEKDFQFHAALYARISVESEEKKERDTIGTQVKLLKDYAASIPELEIVNVYCDDDISGANFDRPAFERMMMDVDNGIINCIIVKDLSRFARDHIGAGEYLERIFPEKGVRFIAITDNIDTMHHDGGIIVPFKNVINELYAKDIACKIMASFKSMQKAGKFVSSKPPYGYVRSEKDKHDFIIDDETAAIVKKIFYMFTEENISLIAIAKSLEKQGIPAPAKYAYEKGLSYDERNNNIKWTSQAVKKILVNETYLGKMVQNRYESEFLITGQKGTFKENKKEDWIVVEGTHDAIISQETFDKAQAIFKKNIEIAKANRMKHKDLEKIEYCLSGILKCGHCGASINVKRRIKNGKALYYYICPVHEVYGSERCPKIAIKMEVADDVVFHIIMHYLETFLNVDKLLQEMYTSSIAKERYFKFSAEIQSLKAKIQRTVKIKSTLYSDMSEGLINVSDYTYFSDMYSKEVYEWQHQLEILERKIKLYDENSYSEIKEQIKKYTNAKKLSRKMAETFVKSITVNNDGEFLINLKIKDEYDELMTKWYLYNYESSHGGFKDAG